MVKNASTRYEPANFQMAVSEIIQIELNFFQVIIEIKGNKLYPTRAKLREKTNFILNCLNFVRTHSFKLACDFS